MTPRLSFQITTSGRPTLLRMLRSLLPQCDPGLDEVLLVGQLEAVTAALDGAWAGWPPGLLRILPCVPGNDWGHTERNLTMRCASGTHLVFGDDDDAFLPGAVEAIRQGVSGWLGPVMFKMRHHNGEILWREPSLQFGNQGTPQFVIPNAPARFGVWTSRHGGDFDFMVDTVDRYGSRGAIKWAEPVIYACRQYAEAAA